MNRNFSEQALPRKIVLFGGVIILVISILFILATVSSRKVQRMVDEEKKMSNENRIMELS